MTARRNADQKSQAGTNAAWDPLELCRFDDYATAVVVDPLLQFTTHKMDVNSSRAGKRITQEQLKNWETIRSIITEFQIVVGHLGHGDYSVYKSTYEKIRNVRKTLHDFETLSEKRLQKHIFLYLKMWDPNSGYTIRECDRYSKEHRGGALYATIDYKRGEDIRELEGCIARMSPEQHEQIVVEGQNDYSIQYSTSKRCSQLWLGPAAFLNHDCCPNSEILSTGPNTASVRATKDIKSNEELLIFYGKGFFGPENCECECRTCERRGAGAFTDKSRSADRRSPAKLSSGKYGLRMTSNRQRIADDKTRKNTELNTSVGSSNTADSSIASNSDESFFEADANENIAKSKLSEEPPLTRKRRRSKLSVDETASSRVSRVTRLRSKLLSRPRGAPT
ncbi:unnamed protein product [Oikopleura dioica]|uniref:[histone H4]-N-methyl-L-lysine20 N-methyltransferase KMT5B n=1 Tax=Oikopleura dioica TaxID=34765 RepID=E4YQ47_OIKDI|nr:unnamed protein product [Oikopleura dioica]